MSQVSREEVRTMKNLLEKLGQVVDEKSARILSENVVEDFVVGEYTVKVNKMEEPGFGKKNRYSVVDKNGLQLVEDLLLFESANNIAKLLNAGHKMYSKKIREIIFLEETYAKYREDIKNKKWLLETAELSRERREVIANKLSNVERKAQRVREMLRNIEI